MAARPTSSSPRMVGASEILVVADVVPARRASRPRVVRSTCREPHWFPCHTRFSVPTDATSSTSTPIRSSRPATHRSRSSLGLVVEDRASGFCGDVVRWNAAAVTLATVANTSATSRGSPAASCWKAGRSRSCARPRTRSSARRSPPPARSPVTTADGRQGRGRQPDLGRGPPRRRARRARVGRRPARAGRRRRTDARRRRSRGAGRRVRSATAPAARDPARPPRRRIEGVAPRGHRAQRPRAHHRASVRRRVGRDPAPRARPRRVARHRHGRAVEGRDVPGARRRSRRLLAPPAQPCPHLRRPATRAGRRRRTPHRLRQRLENAELSAPDAATRRYGADSSVGGGHGRSSHTRSGGLVSRVRGRRRR